MTLHKPLLRKPRIVPIGSNSNPYMANPMRRIFFDNHNLKINLMNFALDAAVWYKIQLHAVGEMP